MSALPQEPYPVTVRTLAYGADPSQVGDLHLPLRETPPIICLFHGGFWRMPHGRDQMAPLAGDLAARGFAVWNLEYRRLGDGGGWPATFEDISNGLDHLADLVEGGMDLDLGRVATLGHSAGGHLALWAAARHRIPLLGPEAVPKVRVAAAVGLAPAADLKAVHELGLSRGVAAQLLGGTPEEVPERYSAASPRALLPMGLPQLLVHGSKDDVVPIDLSRAYALAARESGDDLTLVEPAGMGHFEPLDPRSSAWEAVLQWLDAKVPGLGPTGRANGDGRPKALMPLS